MTSPNSDTVEAVRASGEPTLEKAKKKAQEKVDQLFNISLNIAVTGESGTGKSSFINAIRDLRDDDEGATETGVDEGATETGVTETTSEPTPYKHPTMSNVVFWDLPGIGSPTFQAKKYLKEVHFDKYDFFIIISSERFKENDIMLAKEIQKSKKLFYFIRSKIDNDIQAEEGKRSFDRDQTLSKIRANCEENLKEINNPRVFLISSKDLKSYDIENLVDTLMSELPKHKRKALLLSVPVNSLAILEKKVKMFEKAAWAAAFLSGGIALVPVPGLSAACDVGILVTFFTRCYYFFGLDNKSLERLSEQVNKPHLKSLVMSPLVRALASKSASRLQVSAVARGAAVEFLCSLVPGVGSAAAAFMSFGLTYKLLREGLKELADTARTVLREAGLQ